MNGSVGVSQDQRTHAIMVLSSLFPSRVRPSAGLFVRERMFRVAQQRPLFVVSPVPWFPLQGLVRRWKPDYRPQPEFCEEQRGICVYYPRYLALPLLLRRLDGRMMALGVYWAMRRGKLPEFDLIDSHFSYPDGRAASLLRAWTGKPACITLRGTEVPHSTHPTLLAAMQRAWRGVDRLFAVSDSLKQLAVAHGVPASKVEVVGNGVDSERFHPLARSDARQQLGLADQGPVLITVGGLVERKGFHRVIECLPALLERHPALIYLVVGGASPESNWEPQLRQQVQDLQLQDRVRFLGPVAPDELYRPLSAANLFVLATRNEGWANVLLEAMACGLPVVATDVGGNREVVANPELGSIVPFGDRIALTQAIDAGLHKHWNVAEIVRYAQRNSWQDRVERLAKEFDHLMQNPALRLQPPSIYTRTLSGLLFPLHERLKRHDSVRRRQQLEQSQWLSSDALVALQQRNLQQFIRSVYQHVPYYRGVMDSAGVTPDAIQSRGDLAKLPLLTKALIRQHQAQLRADNAVGLKPFNTGGSSGSPLIFYLNQERVSHDVAAKWRATRWWGVDIGDREIVAWGSPIELTKQDRVKNLRDKLFRSHLIPAFDLGDAQLLAFIQRVRTLRPRMLFGYPSVYDLVARKAEQQQIPLDTLGIQVAFVTSERLYPEQRERIERVFGCPVANGYGGRDAGFIAHQCPHGGMHISAEDIIVEILDPQGHPLPPGEPGEIVVTHLATSAFPFIRYRTGDIGALDPEGCRCGRGLPLLKSIEGRSTDFVVAKDGTIMHGLALIYVLREIAAVDAFKIVQHSLDHTAVELVLDPPGLTAELSARITRGLQARLGAGVRIGLNEVTRIEPEASGKYRYVKSLVDTSQL